MAVVFGRLSLIKSITNYVVGVFDAYAKNLHGRVTVLRADIRTIRSTARPVYGNDPTRIERRLSRRTRSAFGWVRFSHGGLKEMQGCRPAVGFLYKNKARYTMKIYIAGKYSAPTDEEREQNAITMIDYAIEVLKKGHHPFIPLLTHWFDKRANEKGFSLSWQEYMDWDDSFLRACDALFYTGQSTGADIEKARALDLGMTVFTSIDEIPEAI